MSELSILRSGGAGWVPLDILVTVGCVLACVLSVAMLRAPWLRDEDRVIGALRRVRAVAWGLISARFVALLLGPEGDLPVSIYSLIPLLLLSWADALYALTRLLHVRDEPIESES